MTTEPDKLLAEALATIASDSDRAIAMLQRVAESEVGPAWSEAHRELAEIAHGRGELESAECHLRLILDASAASVRAEARAAAGVLLSMVQSTAEQPVDEGLLRSSIEACETLGSW
jgi:hypothetical protein